MNASKKGRVAYDPLNWLAAITSHIPNKGAQNVGYYDAYSNKSKGLRKKEQEAGNKILIADSIPLRKTCTKTWTALILDEGGSFFTA